MFGSKKSKKDKSVKVASAPTYVSQQSTYVAPPPAPAPVVEHYQPAPAPVHDPELAAQELVRAAQGAALDNHNKELVNRVTELKQKRDELDGQIDEEENEKAKFEEHLVAIEGKLQDVIQNLNRKIDMRNEYDQVIQETEAAYSRLLESSRSLLTVLERETLNIHSSKKTSEHAEAMVLV